MTKYVAKYQCKWCGKKYETVNTEKGQQRPCPQCGPYNIPYYDDVSNLNLNYSILFTGKKNILFFSILIYFVCVCFFLTENN